MMQKAPSPAWDRNYYKETQRPKAMKNPLPGDLTLSLPRWAGSSGHWLKWVLCPDPMCPPAMSSLPIEEMGLEMALCCLYLDKWRIQQLRNTLSRHLFFCSFIFHFILFLKFYCSWFTMLCSFLLYSKVIQLHTYIHTYILFHNLFHYGLSQDIEYSSQFYMVGPCCFSILYIIVCIC